MQTNYHKYISLLMNNKLFEDIKSEDIKNILSCFNAFLKNFKKKEIVIREGNPIPGIGIILSGSVQISRTDIMGNINIIAELGRNQFFSETFEAAGIHTSPVSVTSKENTKILFIKYDKIINTCENQCIFHSKIISNMMKIIAVKNTELNLKIDILSKRTIREKLMTYFIMEMNLQGKSRKIKLSFSKTDLADYICTDRSSMSREISRMQKEGIIDVEGRIITIIIR